MSQPSLFGFDVGGLTSSRAVSHASRSASPGAAKALEHWRSQQTCLVCGGRCGGSCETSDPVGSSLRTFLVSALAAMTGLPAAWRKSATPSGRSWWVLKTWAHRTEGNGCGSWQAAASAWPTPNARNGKRGPESRETKAARGSGGFNLREAVRANWPTPGATDWKGESQPQGRRPPCDDDLPSAVSRQWLTPRAEDSEQTGAHSGTPDTLTSATRRSWATPCTAHCPGSHGGGQHSSLRTDVHIPGVVSGPLDPANPSTPGKPRGSLNAAWVSELMGLPPDWCVLSESELVGLLLKPKRGGGTTK